MGKKVYRKVKQTPWQIGQTLFVRNRLDEIEYSHGDLQQKTASPLGEAITRLILSEMGKE